MSVADKDGSITQALGDRMACLSIEIAESLRESAEEFKTIMAKFEVPGAEADDS